MGRTVRKSTSSLFWFPTPVLRTVSTGGTSGIWTARIGDDRYMREAPCWSDGGCPEVDTGRGWEEL